MFLLWIIWIMRTGGGGGMDESTGMAELPTAPLLLPRPLPLPPLLLLL
eukprot:COSAG02_NODE_983_length_15470_cov_4.269924_3_plen_48_part_00